MNGQTMIPVDFKIWAVVAAVSVIVVWTDSEYRAFVIERYHILCKTLKMFMLEISIAFFIITIGIFLSVMLNDDVAGTWMGLLGTNSKMYTLAFIGSGITLALTIINAIEIHRRANAQIRNNVLVEKGHIQDRFKVATERLGNARAGMRIAAYYEFYQLAKDSPDNPDLRENIFEILCAHLRQITTASNYKGISKPTEGVQTLLDLLFKKDESKSIFRGLSANLQRVNLVGVDLFQAHMPCADFSYARLIGANMNFAQLHNCNFSNAMMDDAHLNSTNMVLAKLWGTRLRGTILENTNMQMADIGLGTDFSSAYMYNTSMQGVCYSGAVGQKLSMGGVSEARYKNYESRIRGQQNKQGKISGIIYSGDRALRVILPRTVRFLTDHVGLKFANEYKECMQKDHLGKEINPEGRAKEFEFNINLGAYSSADADEWIAEYKKATDNASDKGGD